MSFGLWTVFYVFALVAAALATFGAVGIVAVGIVLGFWGWVIYGPKPRFRWMTLLLGILIAGILLVLLLPSVQSAREASKRNQCASNLKQIALAVLNYESAKRSFPPAYVADAAGKPMHSWRVLILPYLEEQSLYQKYNFNEPWDGPNNSKLAALIPDSYRCPSHEDDRKGNPTETNYFAVVGPAAVFPGAARRTMRTIADGTANTIMVIEASGLGVNWMEPRDLTLDEAVELLTTKPRSGHRNVEEGFLATTYYETSERWVAFCDGHVLWVGPMADEEIAKALLTAGGGETIPSKLEEKYVESKTTTLVKWGKVWGLCLFVWLAVLPVVWVKRGGKGLPVSSPDERGDVGRQEVVVADDAKDGAI